jgi:prepilin-type N-terminal cleavage/methylation domain-containing protein
MHAMMRSRRGVTLVELVVAMAVGGVVLALVAAISVRQQRLHADLADRLALTEQLRQAATVLPIELRGLAVDAGDLREARDTAVEFRSTIASAVVCDTLSGGVVLAPATAGSSALAGFLTSIADGDTAWAFTPDSIDRWIPLPIGSAGSAAGGGCGRGGPLLDASARALGRVLLRFATASPLPIGSVVRVTRPTRYSLYRGGDGRWYLGAREWNAAANRFNTIQPASGPFMSAAGRGLEFQYFDSGGASLARPVASPRDVALIRVIVRGQSQHTMRAFTAAKSRASDSATVSLALRNRR